jgi:hypothetical protein
MKLPADPRKFERIPFTHEAQVLEHGRLVSAGRAINLSQGGLLLETQPLEVTGCACEVDLPDAVAARGGEAGKVVRSDARGLAIQFEHSLDRARFGRLAADRDPGRPTTVRISRTEVGWAFK